MITPPPMKLKSIRNTYRNLTINTSAMYKDANYWINQCLEKSLEIEALKETLGKCELTFGIIEEIHNILRRSDDSDLRDIIDEIEVDIPLIQAVIKDTLHPSTNGKQD